MDYTSLVRNGYAYTYALVDFTTGDIYTVSCEVGAIALRQLYKRMDSIIREARIFGSTHHLALANCRTNKVLAEVKPLGND